MTQSPESLFYDIVKQFEAADSDVHLGKMMSSPGLKYRDKVFAFYHKEEMGFRLGPQFDPVNFGLNFAKPLSPFKTKPPLKGWYVIEKTESSQWEVLTQMALDFTRTLF